MLNLPQSRPAKAPALGFSSAADVSLDRFLIDTDVVAARVPMKDMWPRADGSHTAVRAAVEFELELVRKRRPVQLVLVIIGPTLKHSAWVS